MKCKVGVRDIGERGWIGSGKRWGIKGMGDEYTKEEKGQGD